MCQKLMVLLSVSFLHVVYLAFPWLFNLLTQGVT